MKMKTKLQITTALAVVFSALLGGCKAMNSLFIHPIHVLHDIHENNEPKYIIHDTERDEYFCGNHIWTEKREYAWEFSKSDAKEIVMKMRDGEMYGPSDVGHEDGKPIIIERK